MIHFANQQAVPAEEVCLGTELSGAAETEAGTPHGGKCFGDEFVQIAHLKPTARAQLKAACRIEASLRYMMQHLDQPMKVPVLSAMVGLSESSFFALFKSATGLTPLNFFIRARMRQAGELLEETTLQIKEVAARLGYDDQYYFSRMFRSVHGVPPREYRARKEESNQQQLQLKPASGKIPAADLSSYLPRWVSAGENQMSERGRSGGFQPAAQRAKACQESCREASALPDSTCSVSIPQ